MVSPCGGATRCAAILDRCPQTGRPLAQASGGYLTADGGFIQCGCDGALFSIEDGACVAGLGLGRSLLRWPLDVRDGMLITA